ncbi:MAG TPA: hypothetical protein VMU28_10160 [Terriglobales bacterium]|nr:hypothetical protein [Terriglobales bacterium]
MNTRRTLSYAFNAILVVLGLTYIGDYAILRYRMATNKNATDQVTIKPYFAIQMKNKDTEFEFQPPYVETCTNSLFPHMGMLPCWYEKKHTDKRTNVLGLTITSAQ